FEEFSEKFIAAARQLMLGDPLSPETDVSALITKKDLARSLEWIEEAKQHGAVLAAGGYVEGRVLSPTVLLHVGARAWVSCKEAFAPIVLINKVDSVDEAIERVNDSDFGLQ